MGKFRARLSEKPPSDPQLERGLHKEAVDFHAAAIPLDMASEGVQAFATIIAQIIAGDPKIIVVDEPEAFLHPALAMKLGNELAISASKSNKQVFVSTHSANFVMGCIQSGAHVTIVRLTYLRGVATARSLPNDRILTLMRNPLLRSAGVINGVFYQAVVVTESDTDRAFYQEINERLLRYDSSRGIPHCLFLNAQNKQTVHIICEPLRRLGIPTVCIVDIDILKEGGSVWASFLSGGCLPLSAQQGLGDMRAKIKLKCVNSGQDMRKRVAQPYSTKKGARRPTFCSIASPAMVYLLSALEKLSLGSHTCSLVGMAQGGLSKYSNEWAKTQTIIHISSRLKVMFGISWPLSDHG